MSTQLSIPKSTRPQVRQPAVALYRTSDDKQESLPTQRGWAQRVSQRDGLSLAGEFEDEGLSGANVTRPGLEKLIAFVRERFFARDPILYLLVLDLDRFSRRDSLSTASWLDQLRKHGLRYIVTTAQRFDLHNALDRTLISLGSDFTREPELRAKSNHVLNGMAERARKGLWMGGPIPYGYRFGESGKLILGPEEEQEVVKWIFRTYAGGRLTSNGIARDLNARGVKPPLKKSSKWGGGTVRKILASRTYLGCIVWGEQAVGRYHRLQKGMVHPREDKEEREQHQLLRGLKHLPRRVATDEDCIICPDAHPGLIDRETFDACQMQRGRNQGNYSAPRGSKGHVWPLAGQMKCGHCGKPIWTLPLCPRDGRGGFHRGTVEELARLACSQKRKDGPESCRHSGMAHYLVILGRVIDLLKDKLANPGAVEEMKRELERQLAERAKTGKVDRQRLTRRLAALDGEIATATRNLLQFPEDLRADAFEALRGLKMERDEVGKTLRDLDAAEQENRGIDPEEFKATLAAVSSLSAQWENREEAELLRATLRDLVQEVRLYWRKREPREKLPRGRQAVRRLVRRIEVDLTPCFADLVNTGSRSVCLSVCCSAPRGGRPSARARRR
jgi:DNA invertase Pin-like site-specific DNA recombinase